MTWTKNVPDEEKFKEFINHFSCSLQSYARYASASKDSRNILNTLFLGKSHAVASRLEEVLDYYNAKNNSKWATFRENTSAIKTLTDVAYITLHLRSTSPQYKLLSGIDLFLEETDKVLGSFYKALKASFKDIVKNASRNGLKECSVIDKKNLFYVDFPEGRLETDLKRREVSNPEKVIVNLATSYLDLASESALLINLKSHTVRKKSELIPDTYNESRIRLLENKFHNLQSLYDTYISNTDSEGMDQDLLLIRGHASIVFHLLEASTSLIHYYERHVMSLSGKDTKIYKPPITGKELLAILFDYYLNYASQFLSAGVMLCRQVISKYAEEGDLEVSVPSYRGFHVRPSTLVAKIVQHYGSKVSLVLGDEIYDASKPMDLFRVNEKINAEKRRNLAFSICNLHSVHDPECNSNFEKGLKEIFHELLEENKIINYSTEFSLPDLSQINEETLGEFANRAIAYLLAQGKIDLRTDLKVSFKGDKRVLHDLQVLAENGYGEDRYGNNIVLPEELSYLTR
ncbi:MAG: HPr family phosphocarrier protein [Spirochaetales bacterium]|nr:HPr family phosphocarrier protein [Spirochaetales bacterium]